jgi:hypothetical protein
MKIKQITETTTAGAIATTETALGGTQSRGNPSIYGGKKVGSLFKGKKTKAPYANSINESAELSEAQLEEDDVIVVPGQGRSRKNGLVPHGQSRIDHEVEMARSDLFSAAKNAQQVYSMIKDVSEDEGLDGWVQEKIIKANDYLNTIREYLEGKQVQGVTEGEDGVDSLVTDTETVMRTFKMDATQELITKALKIVLGEREYKDRPGYYYSFIRQIIARSKQQGMAEGYDPVESDYQQWEDILVKDGYRGDPSGAHALKLVVGNQLMSDPAEVASTIRNILAYIKQNRQVLSKVVSDRKTVKDAIIDIKNKFPQQYQAAQQPHGVAEGTLREISTNLLRQAATVAADKEDNLRKSRYQNHADYQLAVQKGENPDYNQAALRNKDLHAKRLRALDQTNKFTNAADLKSGNLKNHNLTYAKKRGEELKKGTLGRLRTGDYAKKASEIDKDAPWYNRPVWFPDNQQGMAEGASSIEQKIIKLYKQGLSDDEIASRLKIDSDDVKSVLDDYEWVADTTGEEKGVAEGAKVDRMVKHIEKSEKKLGKSKDEAENIAWATANKRGMLNNKNKKA